MNVLRCKYLTNKESYIEENGIKIKEELSSFSHDELSHIDDELFQSLNGSSYGEIFVVENFKELPFKWWISCLVCQKKFDYIDNFLNHVVGTHIGEKSIEKLGNLENEILSDIATQSEKKKIETLQANEVKEEIKSDRDCAAEDAIINIENSSSSVEHKNDNETVDNIKTKNKKKKDLLPPNCEKCNKSFKTQSSLRRHLAVHLKNDNKLYECNICQKTFTKEQKRQWRNHRQRVHKEKIPCKLCEKTFSSKFYIDVHMKTHTGNRDIRCNFCSATFYSQTSLSGHVRKSHLTEKVPCRFCKKLFGKGFSLEIHERTHTGEKPYVCEQCGSAFQSYGLLNNHIKRHNNDRKYECDVCGKKFFNHTYLRDHKVTHTDEKPYVCDICNARFNSRPALRKHVNLHSGVKKYKCKICGKSYAQSPGLYAHMKSHNLAEDKLLNNKT